MTASGRGAGGADFVEELDELGFAVDCAVEGIRTSQQVGVAQVEKEVAWPGVFGLDVLHCCLCGRVGNGVSLLPFSKLLSNQILGKF